MGGDEVLVNVFFDEEMTDIDVIDIPQVVLDDMHNIKQMFFDWLFNKSNNHKYWICVGGVKKYCSYRADAFIEWLNSYYLVGTKEKALCVIMYDTNIDFNRPKISF